MLVCLYALIAIIIVFTTVDLDARGGRGGGRGGGGGGGRRGGHHQARHGGRHQAPLGGQKGGRRHERQSMHRTPSMSRASPRHTSRGRNLSRGKRASSRDVQQFLDIKGPRKGPTDMRRRPAGDRSRERIPQTPVARSRPQSINQFRSNHPTQFRQQSDIGNNIRNDVRNNPRQYRNWYDSNFWNSQPNLRHRFPNRTDLWRAAKWENVSDWVPYLWGGAIFYDYLDEDDSLYYSDDYAEQAASIASDDSYVDSDSEWLPLGVFAMTQEESSTANPNMYMQLAINKDGVIAGTYQNTTTNTAESIQGSVDKDSQRAAWRIVGKDSPVIETGIYNLTNDQSPVLVHFSDGSTQKWLMVRLPDPTRKAGL